MNEAELWDNKYSSARNYENKEDFFRFSKINPTILAIEPFIKDGMSILEVGSGTGELISYIQNTYPNCKTFGLDFSPISIERAKNIVSKFNIPTTFLEGNIRSMSFEGESFDIVFGDQVLGHIDNLDSALKEIYRVTKVGGVVAFSIANSLRPDGWYFNKTFSQSHQGYKQKGMFSWTLSGRLNNSGFKKVNFYGEMLFLFRNVGLVKSFFVENKKNENSTPKVSENIAQKNKSILKKFYYFFDGITPAWLKVTIGIVAKK